MIEHLPIQLDNNDSIRQAAEKYLAEGLHLVVVRERSKVPLSKAWQNAEPKPEHFGAVSNIGVLVGEKSGHLIDLDLDVPEARALSGHDCFFGGLPAFRRTSASPSEPGHRLLRCPDAPNVVVKFDFRGQKETAAIAGLNLPKSVILEIRAGKGQTVLPPSVIGDDKLVWDAEQPKLPVWEWAELRRRAGLLAFAAFAAACYPAEGNRDNFCFHLAGTLVHAGVGAELAEEMILAIAQLRGDEAVERAGKATAAAERIAQGEPVAGLPKFLEFVGMEACEKRIREWLQMGKADVVPAARTPSPDAINITNPNIAERTEQIENAFLESDVEIFRRGADLVFILRLEESETVGGIARAKNSVSLAPAKPDWLAYQASRVMTFMGETQNGMSIKSADARLMRPLLSAIEERRFPVLAGLMTTPTLTRSEPGYDQASKLYLDFQEGEFGEIPLAPSREAALEALKHIKEPAREFPFVDEVARSVWLSAMLTAVIRGELQTAPMFAFDAPSKGTGKTKLGQMVGIMALGVRPPAADWGKNREENEKTLFSILREGDPAVLFDNIEEPVEGAKLCAALTSSSIKGRILGVSETATLGTRTVIMVTGNNLELVGDLTRRTLVCRLNAQVEIPEDRAFDFDPVAYVEANRTCLVAAALTVLRAYHAAGRPTSLKPFNSFEDWDLVRGALVWLGEVDPKDSAVLLRADDPKREEKGQLFVTLLSRYPVGARFKARDLREDELVRLGISVGTRLPHELTRMTGRNQFNAKAVGGLLRRHRSQPFMGVTLKCVRNGVGENEWFFDGSPEPELALAVQNKIDEAKCPF